MTSLSFGSWLQIGAGILMLIGFWSEFFLVRGLKRTGENFLPSMGLPEIEFVRPAELVGTSLPRPVRWTRTGRIWMVLSVVIVGLFLSLAWLNTTMYLDDRHEQSLLAGETHTVTGAVTGKGSLGNHSVYFRYPVGSEKVWGSAKVSSEVFEAVAKGSPLQVKYSIEDPYVSLVQGEIQKDPRWVRFFSLLPCIALLALPFRFFRERRLLSQGKVACAAVTGCTDLGKQLLISYHFRDSSGKTVHGSAKVQKDETISVGCGVVVLFDESKPQVNGGYPFVGVTVG